MQKDETRPLSHILHKIHSSYTENVNRRPETIKLLEENTGRKLFDVRLDSDCFLDLTPKVKAIREGGQISGTSLNQKASIQPRKPSTK